MGEGNESRIIPAIEGLVFPEMWELDVRDEFPAFYELWLGDARVGDATVETADPAPLFIREGDVFADFFPLSVSDSGRECATRAEIRGAYHVVEYINYEGKAKAFTAPELTAISNGFAVLVEEGSGRDFADWRQKIALRVSDEPGKYVALERRVAVTDASGTELELLQEPQFESARHATVNGCDYI